MLCLPLRLSWLVTLIQSIWAFWDTELYSFLNHALEPPVRSRAGSEKIPKWGKIIFFSEFGHTIALCESSKLMRDYQRCGCSFNYLLPTPAEPVCSCLMAYIQYRFNNISRTWKNNMLEIWNEVLVEARVHARGPKPRVPAGHPRAARGLPAGNARVSQSIPLYFDNRKPLPCENLSNYWMIIMKILNAPYQCGGSRNLRELHKRSPRAARVQPEGSLALRSPYFEC